MRPKIKLENQENIYISILKNYDNLESVREWS